MCAPRLRTGGVAGGALGIALGVDGRLALRVARGVDGPRALSIADRGALADAVAACHPTLPNGDTPPGEDPSPSHYGNGRLYTGLWPNGEILADPGFVGADGSIGMKFGWWRAPGVGAAGDLRITGRELTSGALITASIPDGYGQRFQASGITFPTEGCYQITARSGDAELTFVTRVTKVAARSPGK